jgi:NDP-sugar pyrophosphorylase family protein
MKAILLAGGQGTRLRPLTLGTPKPVVPIFNRPFLTYQLDLVAAVPEIDEVVLSLNYQPDRIEDVFGDGSRHGARIRYEVEPTPLGTGGAIKFAAGRTTEAVVVFNGDVLTAIDLAAVIRFHRERRARATIVLTPVENPTAYGLVETDAAGNVRRFLEKPKPDEITTRNINAGVYVLEPDTFDRIPDGVAWSIERSYFPSLVERGETFVAYLYDGYWIDIGTPDKYRQVHQDIMSRRFAAAPFRGDTSGSPRISDRARVHPEARVDGPCFIDEGVVVEAGAHVRPLSVVGRDCHVGAGAIVDGAILWPGCRIGSDSSLTGALVGRACVLGSHVTLGPSAILGDGTVLTDYTRI